MNAVSRIAVLIICSLVTQVSWSQDAPSFKFDDQQYLSQLHAYYSIPNSPETVYYLPLLHHRINTIWSFGHHLTLKADLRSRIFWGKHQDLFQEFASNLKVNTQGAFPMEALWLKTDHLLAHTVADRFYMQYEQGPWIVSAGRQRINWGLGNFWNPLDWFNAFSYLEIDYDEKPGSDGLRIQHFLDNGMSLEVAGTAYDEFDRLHLGLAWKFNLGTYDVQLQLGVLDTNWATGIGWSGYIGDYGYKAEASLVTRENDPLIQASMEWDASFGDGWYVNLSGLYVSEGKTSLDFGGLTGFQTGNDILFPYRWTIGGLGSKQISVRTTGAMSLLYSPGGDNSLIFFPTISYSLSQDWDLDISSQIQFSGHSLYQNQVSAFFLRLKYHFAFSN